MGRHRLNFFAYARTGQCAAEHAGTNQPHDQSDTVHDDVAERLQSAKIVDSHKPGRSFEIADR